MTTPPAAKAYQKGKDIFFYVDLVLNILVLTILMASGLSIHLRNWAASFTSHPWVLIAIYFSVFYWTVFVLFLPVSFFQEFTWEHKFNLSTQGPVPWFVDHLKKSALSFGLGILVIEAVFLFLGCFPATWWIWASVFWLFLTLVLSRIMPNVIIPLFYKYSPVPDQNLRERILEIFKQCDLKIKDVYLINLSKETKKANAFLCGLGKSRRIVLSDTLVANFTIPEIGAVVAHEIAHYKHRDIWRMIILNTAMTVVGFFLMDKFLRSSLPFFGIERLDDIAFLPVFLLGMIGLNLVGMPFLNAFSRWMEIRADQFSLKLTKDPGNFISMMNKLGMQNLAEFEPHWLKELMFYDHPSLARRIRFAEASRAIG